MDRLEKITRELAVLDAKRVPGIASQENFAFLAALDKHWPTIRGMLAIARSPITPENYISDRVYNGKRSPRRRTWLGRLLWHIHGE